MTLGICTIQRNRAPWILEWCAFHYLMGFRKFYFFMHRCTDNSEQILQHLQQKIDIKTFVLGEDVQRPQLQAYQYAYQQHGSEVDWMAFIDGDEFLFPTRANNLNDAITKIDDGAMSGIGAYWSCFGSSKFILEPQGLVTENYRYRAPDDFIENRHIKSIIRGGLGGAVSTAGNAHLFVTPNGTCDEQRRPITSGRTDYEPSWNELRINHYVCQSLSYFLNFKQMSGNADAGANYVRPQEWWTRHDRNEVHDASLEHFYPELRRLVREFAQ